MKPLSTYQLTNPYSETKVGADYQLSQQTRRKNVYSPNQFPETPRLRSLMVMDWMFGVISTLRGRGGCLWKYYFIYQAYMYGFFKNKLLVLYDTLIHRYLSLPLFLFIFWLAFFILWMVWHVSVLCWFLLTLNSSQFLSF